MTYVETVQMIIDANAAARAAVAAAGNPHALGVECTRQCRQYADIARSLLAGLALRARPVDPPALRCDAFTACAASLRAAYEAEEWSDGIALGNGWAVALCAAALQRCEGSLVAQAGFVDAATGEE